MRPRARWTLWGTLPVLAYAAWLRAVDLDPPSLHVDDAWVAVLSKVSLGELFAHGSSSPPLFNLLVAACIAVVPDPELAGQLLPFLFGVLAVGAVAWAAHLLTGNPACAVFAASVYACEPRAVEYAARVKQYSSDALLSAVELGLFCLLLSRYTRRRLWVSVAIVCLGLLLSSASFFVAAALFPLGLCVLWRRHRDPQLGVAAGALLVASIGVFLAFVQGGHNQALHEYWRPGFLPTDSLPAFARRAALALHLYPARALHGLEGAGVHQGPVPGAAWLGVALCGLGAVTLWSRRQRPHLLAVVLLAGLLLAASAAERFPLGTHGRVDLFVIPWVACLMACGLKLTARLDRRRWRKLGPILGLALAVLQLSAPRRPTYPQEDAAPLVRTLAAALEPGDAVRANVHGTFALGYYGPWPVELVPDPRLGTGFHCRPRLEGFAVLGEQPPQPAAAQRVFLFGSHHRPSELRAAYEALVRQGHTAREVLERPGAVLIRLERP